MLISSLYGIFSISSYSLDRVVVKADSEIILLKLFPLADVKEDYSEFKFKTVIPKDDVMRALNSILDTVDARDLTL